MLVVFLCEQEEKAFLLKELEVLQAQVHALRNDAKRNARARDNRSLLQQALTAGFLREAVQMQQVSLVSVQSALSGCLGVQRQLPYEMDIHLGTDLGERRETLTRLKMPKLRAAQRFLEERARFVDPVSPFSDSSRFALDDGGGYCSLQFDVTPFEGVTSVKQVYDALLFHYSNIEIRVTEVLGDVTIREDDDSERSGIFQSRLVSHLTNGVQMEGNTVTYTDYHKPDGAGGEAEAFGIFTREHVDVDELYPYVPNERVRQDVTSAVTVEARTRTQRKGGSSDQSEEQDQVVVMTRSCLLKIRRPQLEIPPEVMHELREGIDQWGDVMLQTVREHVYGKRALEA